MSSQQSTSLEMALVELFEKFLGMADKELYDFVLDKIVLLTSSKIGFFHLISDDEKMIHLTTWNKEALKNCKRPTEGHYPLEKAGNWVDCVRQKKPVIYNDFPKSPNQKGLPSGHVPLTRFMSIPVIQNGKVKVIFGVGNKESDYTQEDVRRIQIFANSLENIITQRETQLQLVEKIKELEKMNQYMTGRELKMAELKAEIKELKKKNS